jgi:hypothetical protein
MFRQYMALFGLVTSQNQIKIEPLLHHYKWDFLLRSIPYLAS